MSTTKDLLAAAGDRRELRDVLYKIGFSRTEAAEKVKQWLHDPGEEPVTLEPEQPRTEMARLFRDAKQRQEGRRAFLRAAVAPSAKQEAASKGGTWSNPFDGSPAFHGDRIKKREPMYDSGILEPIIERMVGEIEKELEAAGDRDGQAAVLVRAGWPDVQVKEFVDAYGTRA